MTLEGTLKDMSLADLFHMFHASSKTGLLMLFAPNERGLVYVAAGRLVDAAVVRSADRKVLVVGESAVLQLLQWQEAHFTFSYSPAVMQHPIRITCSSTKMLEAAQRHAQPPVPLDQAKPPQRQPRARLLTRRSATAPTQGQTAVFDRKLLNAIMQRIRDL